MLSEYWKQLSLDERDGREKGRKERRLLAGALLSVICIVKRDEPPLPLGGRAMSEATIFEIYRG